MWRCPSLVNALGKVITLLLVACFCPSFSSQTLITLFTNFVKGSIHEELSSALEVFSVK